MKFENVYYFITQSSDYKVTCKSVKKSVEETLRGGCKIVQYREKLLPYTLKAKVARELRALTREYGALLIINDDPFLAKEVQADGVHVGQKDMGIENVRRVLPGRVVGVTVSTLQEAVQAANSGADYLGVGPIFSTHTKVGAKSAIGLQVISLINERLKVPLAAIGGINFSNYRDALKSGADAVCMISAMLKSENVEQKTREVIEHGLLLHNAKQ